MPCPAVLAILTLASAFTRAPSKPVDTPPKRPEPGIHRLTQEIYALRTLYQLRINTAQLKALEKLAPDTMAKERIHKKTKVSDDYRTIMNDLRKALVEADSDDRINELEEKLADLHESEAPEPDDTFDVTEAARACVPEFYKLLKPYQLTLYFASQIEETLDPLDEVVAALEDIREYKDEDWKEHRDELAEEMAWMICGLDQTKAEKVNKEIADLLTQARGLKEMDFKQKKPTLEKKAHKIIGKLDPSDVLRNHLQRTLADLLSNPRLDEVVKARLEPEK